MSATAGVRDSSTWLPRQPEEPVRGLPSRGAGVRLHTRKGFRSSQREAEPWFKKSLLGVGAMAQWLRAPCSCRRPRSGSQHLCQGVHNCLQLQLQGSLCPLKMTTYWGWKAGLGVKSTSCSSRGHSSGPSTQWPTTIYNSSSMNPTLSLGLRRHQTYM